MKKYNIGELILKINPSAKAIIHGDDIDTCTIEWIDGTNPISIQDIKNIISTYGDKSPCLVFVGHTDVVPPGDLNQWKTNPYRLMQDDGIDMELRLSV